MSRRRILYILLGVGIAILVLGVVLFIVSRLS
jgi:nitrogen fixation-related uncharacterized protein